MPKHRGSSLKALAPIGADPYFMSLRMSSS